MHHPPLPPGPGLSLPVAVGALLCPPELLRPRLNRHLGQRVEPLAGERRPPRPSRASSRPGSRRSSPDAGKPVDVGICSFSGDSKNSTAPSPGGGPGGESSVSFSLYSTAGPRSLTPFRCTTTGMSIVPLEPLAQRLEAWLTLPSLSRWLTLTIWLGYAIQFARWPPKFNGVLETSVAVRNAPVLCKGIAVLLAKDAIEPVPPAEMRQGFYSPYFIVPKNYLDDWLILAQSREQLGDHRDLVLRHLSQLGHRVNWEKSKLSPVQRISFLGVELDSVSMTVHGKAWSHREVPEGGQEDESLQVTPFALLGPLYRPGWTSEGPLWAAGLSRAEVPVS